MPRGIPFAFFLILSLFSFPSYILFILSLSFSLCFSPSPYLNFYLSIPFPFLFPSLSSPSPLLSHTLPHSEKKRELGGARFIMNACTLRESLLDVFEAQMIASSVVTFIVHSIHADLKIELNRRTAHLTSKNPSGLVA